MKNLFVLSLCSLLLTACSGGSSGGSSSAGVTPGTSVSGTLVDSAVGGVFYRSESTSGMTNDSGTYSCKSGESVEFYLKGDNNKEISLGSVACNTVTSPIEIMTEGQFTISSPLEDLSESQSSSVVYMLRLLQSLDSDANPGNGITVRPADISILANSLEQDYTLNVALKAMFDSGTFDLKMSSVMSDIGRALVSEADAVAHFNDSREICEGDFCGVVIPPVEEPVVTQCLEGLSYATSTFSPPGIVYGSNYVINTETGLAIEGLGFLDKTNMTIVLKPDHSAEVYRKSNNASSYFKFHNDGWTANVAGEVTVNGVYFSNQTVDLKFGVRTDLGGGLMGRYATSLSFGSMNTSFDLMFREPSFCSVPSNAVLISPPVED